MAFCLGTSADLERIHAKGRWFVDAAGRVRLFHGFNDVNEAKGSGYKPGGSDYTPKVLMNRTNLDSLANMGFNVMRLPMMWAAVAPFENKFDEDYLQTMVGVVDSLADRGMYGFLDMHQDVMSQPTGKYTYDGAPRWVMNRTEARRPYPWPLPNSVVEKAWALGYVTEAVGQSFQELYDNTHGGLDAWEAFWVKVAQTFRRKGSVLAYELINEPFAGDIFKHPGLLKPSEAGRRNLQPVYNKLAEAIRRVDGETMLMFEPMTGLPGFGTGFDDVPGGQDFRNRSALSWHYYCYMSSSLPEVLKQACEKEYGPQVFQSVGKTSEALGIPIILTEFGAMTPTTAAGDKGTEEIQWILDQADATLQSWTYWDLSQCCLAEHGGLSESAMDVFIRPYASAIAGEPQTMSFDSTTGVFELSYMVDPSISEPTELQLPLERFPNGYVVNVTEGLRTVPCQAPGSAHRLCLAHSSGCSGTASVTVAPKSAMLV